MRITLFAAYFALSLYAAFPAWAVHTVECTLAPDKKWSETESWVWSQTCRGKAADITTSGLNNELRAEFIQTILLHKPWTDHTTHKGVRIIGANIKEALDLSHATIRYQLWIDHSNLTTVTLNNATIGAPLSFEASTVSNQLNMKGIKTSSDVFMHGGTTIKNAYLNYANIGGRLVLDGISISENLNLDNLKTASDLSMGGGSNFKNVFITNAIIQGRLILSGSTVSGLLDMDKIQTSSSLIMSDMGHFQDVRLTGATINGQLAFNGSTIDKTLNMEDLTVKADLFMSEGASFNIIDLTSANIHGAIILGTPDGSHAKWQRNDSYLDLNNARVSAIWDQKEAWPPSVTLQGLTYADFGFLDSNMGERNADWLITWLKKSQPFSPQPYEQLATVLRKHGYSELVDEILYAKEDRIRTDRTHSIFEEFYLFLKWVTVGYGYHPFWALIWLAVIIAIGSYVACKSNHKDLKSIHESIEYSADMVVPIVRFREIHTEIDHKNFLFRVYFYFHQLMGYFLAYFVISAMTTT